MKTRERIKRIREAKGFTQQIALAEDDLPGTEFDGFFLDCAEHWTWTHRSEPDAADKARCPVTREFLASALRKQGKYSKEVAVHSDKTAAAFYDWVGHGIADACVRGASNFIRQLANALDTWMAHNPNPDSLRSAVVSIALEHRLLTKSETVSVQHIIKSLPANGVKVDENTPRIVRRICGELRIKIAGKAGNPLKSNPDTKRSKAPR